MADDPTGALSDSAWKIIRDLGPVKGTAIVVVILVFATAFKWLDVLRQWVDDAERRKLEWARFELEKRERDAALRAPPD